MGWHPWRTKFYSLPILSSPTESPVVNGKEKSPRVQVVGFLRFIRAQLARISNLSI
jgi:hypothetical protein